MTNTTGTEDHIIEAAQMQWGELPAELIAIMERLDNELTATSKMLDQANQQIEELQKENETLKQQVEQHENTP